MADRAESTPPSHPGLDEATWEALRKFLARADLKGHEVPEFSRMLRELEALRLGRGVPTSGSRPG